ncbi:MAG: hypothetical protein ACUVS5_11850 [Anaerolineae bacterium]
MEDRDVAKAVAEKWGCDPADIVVVRGRPVPTGAAVWTVVSKALAERGWVVRGVRTEVLADGGLLSGSLLGEPVTIRRSTGSVKAPDTCIVVQAEVDVGPLDGGVVCTFRSLGAATFKDSQVSTDARAGEYLQAVLLMHAETRALLRGLRLIASALGHPLPAVAEERPITSDADVGEEPEDPGDTLVPFLKVKEKYGGPVPLRTLWEDDPGMVQWIASDQFRGDRGLHEAAQAFLASLQGGRGGEKGPEPSSHTPDPNAPLTKEQVAQLSRVLREGAYAAAQAQQGLLRKLFPTDTPKSIQDLTLIQASWVGGYVRTWKELVGAGVPEKRAKEVALEVVKLAQERKLWANEARDLYFSEHSVDDLVPKEEQGDEQGAGGDAHSLLSLYG